jgi:hypothetical protein
MNVVEQSQQVGHVLGLAAATGTMPFIMAGTIGGELIGRLTDHGVTNEFTELEQALNEALQHETAGV